MDETNLNQTQNPENQAGKTDSRYFYFALFAIVLGFAITVGVFLWVFPSQTENQTEPMTTSASNQINSPAGLDQANQQLDQTDLTSFSKDLQANDSEAANF